jgi:hypothetical protein
MHRLEGGTPLKTPQFRASTQSCESRRDISLDQPGDAPAIVAVVEELIRIAQLRPVDAPVDQRRAPAAASVLPRAGSAVT